MAERSEQGSSDVNRDIEGLYPICLARAATDCGEGPFWSVDQSGLYWVNITGGRLHFYDPTSKSDTAWDLPQDIGCAVPRACGGLVLTLAKSLAFFDPRNGDLGLFFDPRSEDPNTMLNDGKCDSAGRLWFTSYYLPIPRQPEAGLYRLDPDLTCRKIENGFHVANGPAWSPDEKTMYITDGISQKIFAYDFDVRAGSIENKRVFVSVPEEDGRPDGITVDAEGCVWNGHADGWRLTRYSPDGQTDRVIRLPTQVVTNCAFGGPNLDYLYITTARWGISHERLAEQPLAGGLFGMDPGVKGLPETPFAG